VESGRNVLRGQHLGPQLGRARHGQQPGSSADGARLASLVVRPPAASGSSSMCRPRRTRPISLAEPSVHPGRFPHCWNTRRQGAARPPHPAAFPLSPPAHGADLLLVTVPTSLRVWPDIIRHRRHALTDTARIAPALATPPTDPHRGRFGVHSNSDRVENATQCSGPGCNGVSSSGCGRWGRGLERGNPSNVTYLVVTHNPPLGSARAS